MLAYLLTLAVTPGPASDLSEPRTQPKPIYAPPKRNAQLAQASETPAVGGATALTLTVGEAVMVVVEGAPSPQRIAARESLERRLRQEGFVVLNHHALGPDRSRLDPRLVEGCWQSGVERLLVVSVDDYGGGAVVRVRSLTSQSSGSEVESGPAIWSGRQVDNLRVVALPGDSPTPLLASDASSTETRFELYRPSTWQPRLGRGPDLRPVLRERSSGELITYAEAYARIGRDDWQHQYDRRMRVRLAMLSTGSLVFAGGLTSTFVFALPGEPLRGALGNGDTGAAVGLSLATLTIGSGIVAASYLIDPHPVSIETFSSEVRSKSSTEVAPLFGLRLQASPEGATAGFRATF